MLESFYNTSISRLEAILSTRYWAVYVTLFTFFTIWLLTAPNYFALTKDFHVCDGCADFQAKINRADHLLKPTNYPDHYHMAKTQFRITIALIAKITGVRSIIGMFVLQQLFGLTFLTVASLLSFKITNDKIVAALLTLSLGFIYAGKAAFVDTLGFTDSFAYCFLLIALFTNNKTLLVSSLLFGFFTDERAIIASFFIAIFFFAEYTQTYSDESRLVLFIKSRLFFILISWAVCFIIRYLLAKLYGFYTPSAGANVVDFYAWGYIFWEGLQGFWLLILGACVYLILMRSFFILFLIIAGLLFTMIVTSMVSDITRSIAYVFPVIFLGLYFLEKGVTKSQLRKILVISSLISFCCADSFYGRGAEPIFDRSLPIKLMQKVFK